MAKRRRLATLLISLLATGALAKEVLPDMTKQVPLCMHPRYQLGECNEDKNMTREGKWCPKADSDSVPVL